MALTAQTGIQVNQTAAFRSPDGRYLTRRGRRALFGDLAIVVFLCAQILDGAFTYVGLHIFGPAIEANPVIAWLIAAIGPAAALAFAKTSAMIAGAFLHLSSVHGVVAVLTGLYLLAAIGPWTHLLFFF